MDHLGSSTPPAKTMIGPSSTTPPKVDIHAIEVEESYGATWVILRIYTRISNPSNSPADTREAFFSAKLSWTDFKKHPDAKDILCHLCKPSKKYDACLKELEGGLEAELEPDSTESTGSLSQFSSIFRCF